MAWCHHYQGQGLCFYLSQHKDTHGTDRIPELVPPKLGYYPRQFCSLLTVISLYLLCQFAGMRYVLLQYDMYIVCFTLHDSIQRSLLQG